MDDKYTIKDVLDDGLCVGCGTCAAIAPNSYSMNNNGKEIIASQVGYDAVADKVCPFSDNSLNETSLANRIFSNLAFSSSMLGYYNSVHCARSTSDDILQSSSSGGITTELAIYLKEKGVIDWILHVKNCDHADRKFEFAVSHTVPQLLKRSKSSYYPVEMSEVLLATESLSGNGLLIGVPCFIKSVRNAQTQANKFENIKLFFSLVCGHMKSKEYADFIAKQAGIDASDLKKIDFRVKDPARPANDYAVSVKGNKKEVKILNRDLFGISWGYGFFMLKACQFCDDVAGELADCTLGDSWLPRHIKRWEGTNIVISRNPIIDDALKELALNKRITLEASNEQDFVAAQQGCYNQRRAGLVARLSHLDKLNVKYPSKRFLNAQNNKAFGEKFLLREYLRSESFSIWRTYYIKQKNYKKTMRKFSYLMLEYDILTRGKLKTFLSRTKQKLLACKKFFLNYF